uniref:uncharacterized protein LOC120348172 n=1 Tax=Styela clava TaxID=7725 RepID=UPI00193957BB|nr:uncharacterized protein LOC120348172 [Styela clava]
MTKGFRLLETESAILLMILTLITNFMESSTYSILREDNNGFQKMVTETITKPLTVEFSDIALLHRLLALKSRSSTESDNKSFLRNRFSYFKPRRKIGKRIPSQKLNEFSSQNNDTQNFSLLNTGHNEPQYISKYDDTSTNNNRRRIRRSTSGRSSIYDQIFNSESSSESGNHLRNLDSKSTDELFKRQEAVFKMYHKESSSYLKILSDGSIIGESKEDEFYKMKINAVDYDTEKEKAKVQIYGLASGYYIAMNKSGKLYTTKNILNEDTVFLHYYNPLSHDAYLSDKHSRFITMRAATQGRTTPARAKNIIDSSKTPPKRAYFLVSNASAKKEALPKTSSFSVSTTPQKQLITPFEAVTTARTMPTTQTVTTVKIEETSIQTTEKLFDSTTVTPPTVSTTSVSKPKTKRPRKSRRRKEGKRGRKRKSKNRKRNRKEKKRKNKKSKKGKNRGRNKAKTRSARSLVDSSTFSNHISSDIFHILTLLEPDDDFNNLNDIIESLSHASILDFIDSEVT